uniref:Uncharacterized protein n=1 Tax=Solanum lycopersicum TaxID=4081 RepID=A0A3Q7ERK3_SOLLC
MILTNAIGFCNKFTGYFSGSRAVPSVYSKHFTEYFVESNGEILLIFLISIRKVDKVEVMNLQMDGTNCCISVNASELDCRSNCIYFNEFATWKFYELGI